MNKTAEKVVAKLAYATAEKEANQGCPWLFYQPRLPEKVQKLNKFK
ncbi:MAG TPA: cyclic lactone autoinducer peptide [Lachnospiraceae bacterium]|nr:cyclic lactone autoinducer peptide [uncultured Lachnoclostridium sp.]HAU84335.1 cyclic lactone autoinducer peptide [Lachnospiraceae bacterium]